MNYDTQLLVTLANKYLDRVEVKGLNEYHEFGYLYSLFTNLSNNVVLLVPANPEGGNPPN